MSEAKGEHIWIGMDAPYYGKRVIGPAGYNIDDIVGFQVGEWVLKFIYRGYISDN